METALSKLEAFLAKENIIISVNRPNLSFTDNGTLLITPSTIGVTYKESPKEVSDAPTAETKEETTNG